VSKQKTDICHCGKKYTIAYDFRTGFRKNKECPSCQLKLAVSKPRKEKQGKSTVEKESKRRTAWRDKPTNELITYIQEKLCNPYIRVRDKANNYSCISCRGKITQAGHFFPRSTHKSLCLNIQNIHGQEVSCNKHKSGNLLIYRKNLISRHGIDYVEELEKFGITAQSQNTKFDRFNLLAIAETFIYLTKNNIWIFRQVEFDKIKVELLNNK
jgi:5-methylcytosine-specific restriction endonuclease McrA